MIVAAMLEALKTGAVVDRLVEQFQQGRLPIGRGHAGRKLSRHWRRSTKHIGEPERRHLQAILFDAMVEAAAEAMRRLPEEAIRRPSPETCPPDA